jgi:Na+-driven multidrug efflux pump
MYYFDRKNEFSDLAAFIFPIISVLVFFDVLQLILAGAFRGISNVTFVMKVRCAVIIGYFIPASFLISVLPLENVALKMVLMYSSFYIGNVLMSMIYINKFRSNDWKSAS